MAKKCILLVFLFACTEVWGQVNPHTDDPTLGSLLLTTPSAAINFISPVMSTDLPPEEKILKVNTVTSSYAGDINVSFRPDAGQNNVSPALFALLGVNFKTTVIAGQTTTTRLGAVQFQSGFTNTEVSLWNSPRLLAINGHELGEAIQGPLAPSFIYPYIAYPGRYSLQYLFSEQDELKKYILDVPPAIEFEVHPDQVTPVALSVPDRRATIETYSVTRPLFPLIKPPPYTGSCSLGSDRSGAFPNTYVYLHDHAEPLDFLKNRMQSSNFLFDFGSPYVAIRLGESRYVWPIKPTAPQQYYISVNNITEPLKIDSASDHKVEIKTMNVNDVRITLAQPGSGDVFVKGRYSIYRLDNNGNRDGIVQIDGFDVENKPAILLPHNPECVAVRKTTTQTVFPTGSSIELLPGRYQMSISFFHPELKKNQYQRWNLNCEIKDQPCIGTQLP